MKNYYRQLLESNGWVLLVLYLCTAFLLAFTDMELVNTDIVYAEYLEELSQTKYNEYDEFVADFEDDLADIDLDDEEEIDWEGLAFDAVFVLLKFMFSVPLVAAVLLIGFTFYQQYERITYRQVFKATMLANFVFLIPSLVSSFWFLVIQTDYTFQDLQAFKPLYFISLLDRSTLPSWSMTPLYFINLYEVLFLVLTALGISMQCNLSWQEMLKKTSLFYFAGLAIWSIVWIYVSITL